ncbi:hypothetical protein EON66_06295 [archaeon]|nr:MAG: hypothetical protein EON66_06295 [archaeon]
MLARAPAHAENATALYMASTLCRYGKMYQCFQQLVMTFETDPDNFPRLTALMQTVRHARGLTKRRAARTRACPLCTCAVVGVTLMQLQEYGNVPPEIIADLAPGLELTPDGMPVLPNMGAGGMPNMPSMAPGACSIM